MHINNVTAGEVCTLLARHECVPEHNVRGPGGYHSKENPHIGLHYHQLPNQAQGGKRVQLVS